MFQCRLHALKKRKHADRKINMFRLKQIIETQSFVSDADNPNHPMAQSVILMLTNHRRAI